MSIPEQREPPGEGLSRRQLFEVSAAASLPLLIAACGGSDDASTTVADAPDETTTAPTGAGGLAPTPACDDGDEATPEQTEGPYFTPDSPERASLLGAGVEGTPLVLAGYALSPDCEPLAGALLDFWQANDAGEYDLSGYELRGHQFADEKGRYRLETIVPGRYVGRTRHIHVKAQPENGTLLTTQLYFPDEPQNAADGLFDERLLIDVDAPRGRFDFVLG